MRNIHLYRCMFWKQTTDINKHCEDVDQRQNPDNLKFIAFVFQQIFMGAYSSLFLWTPKCY